MPLCQILTAEQKQRIDRGLAEIDLRSIVQRDNRIAARARHPHMMSAGRQIDLAGLDRLAIDGLVRAPARCPCKMFGKNSW